MQNILRKKLGLIVDKPKPGGSGNSNDGNTARRAFENPAILAEYLGLNCQLLQNFKTILIALSIHLPINSNEFDRLCSRTAELYVANYSWFPMPATLHKILIHGADIISTSIIPVGMLGEEASEARNKHYKNYREHHSRKISHTITLTDVFYRLMDTSEIIISSLNLNSRLRKKKFQSIPQEVTHLLAAPEVNVSSHTTSHVDNDSDSDNDNNDTHTDLLHTFTYLEEVELAEELTETD